MPRQSNDLKNFARSSHAPRFLLLYGSVQEQSCSRLLIMEVARVLEAMGGEVKVFDPRGLPLLASETGTHFKVEELHDLVMWSEGMVWCSPERNGDMTEVMRAQIDCIPLVKNSLRLNQGRTLAVIGVSGGSKPFNAVNQMRMLGQQMRMIIIPNQSVVAERDLEFEESGRMKRSTCFERIANAMEDLVKFTLLTRDASSVLATY